MANLSFMDKLTESQVEYAEKIAKAAKAAGVPPRLAVAIAYQESGLNPNAKDGGAGEIGIMQVRQSTGKMLGSSEKDLRDPDKNIATGIRYLKQALDATKGDQKLATIGYNAGIDSKFFSGGDLPASTQDYLRSVNGYGAFEGEAPGKKKEQDSEMVAVPAKPIDDASSAQERARIKREENDQETRMAQYYGAGAGATGSGLAMAGTGIGKALESGAQRIGAGYKAGREGGLPVNAPRASKPSVGGLPGTQAQIERIQAGTTGDLGTTGRARMGFNADTAQLAAAEKNQAAVVDELRSKGSTLDTTKKVFGNAPGMTSTPAGIAYPRSEPPNYLGPRGPEGQVGFNRPPTVVPKGPSGLDTVTDTFKSMMRSPAAQGFSALAKRLMPPLALAEAAGQGTQLMQEAKKPASEQDLIKMILHGVGAVGGGLSAFPPTAPIGVPMVMGSEAAQLARDPENQSWLQRKFDAVQAADIPPSNPMGDYFGN